MQYWLMKSEPDVWSIDQQKKAGAKGAPWDGVRNYQAAKNLKSMKKGDGTFELLSDDLPDIVPRSPPAQKTSPFAFITTTLMFLSWAANANEYIISLAITGLMAFFFLGLLRIIRIILFSTDNSIASKISPSKDKFLLSIFNFFF